MANLPTQSSLPVELHVSWNGRTGGIGSLGCKGLHLHRSRVYAGPRGSIWQMTLLSVQCWRGVTHPTRVPCSFKEVMLFAWRGHAAPHSSLLVHLEAI